MAVKMERERERERDRDRQTDRQTESYRTPRIFIHQFWDKLPKSLSYKKTLNKF